MKTFIIVLIGVVALGILYAVLGQPGSDDSHWTHRRKYDGDKTSR